MKTDMKMTVELSPDEIKTAIANYIRIHSGLTGVTVSESDITFQVQDSYHSNDPREGHSAGLTGAKVKINSRPKSTPSGHPDSYVDR